MKTGMMSRETTSKITISLILATAAVWIAWDVYAAWDTGGWSTISWVIYVHSTQRPAIPFAAGLLCGHLFLSFPPAGGD